MRGLKIPLTLLALCIAQQAQADARSAEAKRLIEDNCGACHRVPGVARAVGRVGPSLDGIARQQIIAGHFANTPATLERWIAHPQQMLPGNAMPEMGLSQDEVRTIANYLYTLE